MSTITNFMEGENFSLCPLYEMETIWSSAIIGEPQYYKDDDAARQTFFDALQKALDTDFDYVLQFAVRLRKDHLMRLGPQIVLVECALHPSRQAFNAKNPNRFRQIAAEVIQIPTDMFTQMEYYKYKKGSKSQLPGILKRCWKDAMEKMSVYQMAKYQNKAHLVDMIRLCHPRSRVNPTIEALVKEGSVLKTDSELTWETLRSRGASWKVIVQTLGKAFPHMALLRNIYSVAKELSMEELATVLRQLEAGVPGGKQFPFRYYTAYQQLESRMTVSEPSKPPPKDKGYLWKKFRLWKKTAIQVDTQTTQAKKRAIQDSLETCMRNALQQLPEIPGVIVSLCDNSGSAWGTFNSSYGSQTVATIGNLSGLFAALRSTEGGMVGVFGDRLEMYQVSKDKGILTQLEEINALGKTVGQGTENGIWLWFKNAHESPLLYKNVDNLFIYSDMQAGHGKLYGRNPRDYDGFRVDSNSSYISVLKLLERHRRVVNHRLNLFSVMTAGYNNSILPEVTPRTAILSGWTGNELHYARRMMEIWDSPPR